MLIKQLLTVLNTYHKNQEMKKEMKALNYAMLSTDWTLPFTDLLEASLVRLMSLSLL